MSLLDSAIWAIELVADRGTRDPLAPYGGSGEQMNAIIAASKRGGLLPFTNFNRIHAVPPLTSTADEIRAGIAILDDALGQAMEVTT